MCHWDDSYKPVFIQKPSVSLTVLICVQKGDKFNMNPNKVKKRKHTMTSLYIKTDEETVSEIDSSPDLKQSRKQLWMSTEVVSAFISSLY